MAAFAVLGDLGDKLLLRLGRIRLVRIAVATPVLMAIGTVDIRARVRTMDRLVQGRQVNPNIQHLAGGQDQFFICIGMA